MMASVRRLPALAAAVVLAAALTGCGGEDPPYDDGSQSVPLAGLSVQIEDAGVEVVAPERPADARPDRVVTALEDADVASPAEIAVDSDPADVLAFDPTATAGLLGVVGDDPGTTLALVFTTPDAAAVFAAADPEVFSDAAVDRSREAYLAGNVVGYATPDADGATRLRTALESLVGAGTPSGTATS